MRTDAIGMFWQDVPITRGNRRLNRVMPPIPETGWKPPVYYPNLSAAKVLSIDVETYDPELLTHGPGWGRGKGHICGFSVGTDDGYRCYFPIRHTIEKDQNLDPQAALRWLRDTLSNPRQPKVGANLIYDIGWLEEEGVKVVGELVDVQFAEALLTERANTRLEALADKYLGEGKAGSVLFKWLADFYGGKPGPEQRANIYRSPPRLAGPYGEGDADLPIRLAPIFYQYLNRERLVELFRMECALIPLLVQMRKAAVTVDINKAQQVSDELNKRAEIEHKKLDLAAGMRVEINSADSLSKAFNKAGLKYPRTAPSKNRPNGNPSFTKEFLASVEHPIADSVREIRRLEKLNGTFVKGYILEGNTNGKIYCSFHPLRGTEGGARSGRFSSSMPNLQNIPARDPELGKLIRSLFKPDTGHEKWRKYDYSQIEFRFLVHYAIGPGSLEARARYNREPKTDYHEMVRELVQFATKREWDRRPVKNLNFGKIYGMGDAKAARTTGLEGHDLELFLAAYDKAVPFAKSTLYACRKEADQLGFVTTILGRKSRFDLWGPRRWEEDQIPLPYEAARAKYGPDIIIAMTHKALNRRLQGSAADLLKVAMLKCWQDGIFAETGIPRLTVHDELDFSDPGGIRDEAWRELLHTLENALKISVPIRVDYEYGPDWGNLIKMKENTSAGP